MKKHLGHTYLTIVRPLETLPKDACNGLLQVILKPGSKRVVTFLRGEPKHVGDSHESRQVKGRIVLRRDWESDIPDLVGPLISRLVSYYRRGTEMLGA